MTHVLIVDDHPVVLQGLGNLLESIGVDKIEQARSASEAFQAYRKCKPDLIVVDLAMRVGSLNGLSFLRRLRRIDEGTPVLVLTMHRDPLVVGWAFELGASGYVYKGAGPEEFLQAFHKVIGGGSYLSHDLASDLVFRRLKVNSNRVDGLLPRERQILTLIAEGRSHKEIARRLDVSLSTVDKTSTKLKVKLGVRTRPELIRTAIEHLPTAEQNAAESFRRRLTRIRRSPQSGP